MYITMRTAWKWFWNDNNLKHISSFWSIVAKSFTKRIRAADVAEKKCNWVRRIWNTINTNANILLKKTFENVREWIFSRCINWTIKIYFRCNYKDQDCVFWWLNFVYHFVNYISLRYMYICVSWESVV